MALGTEASQNRSWVKALTKTGTKKKCVQTKMLEPARHGQFLGKSSAATSQQRFGNKAAVERAAKHRTCLVTSLSLVSRSNKLAQTRTTTREKYRWFRVKVAMHSRTGLEIGKCATSWRSVAFGKKPGNACREVVRPLAIPSTKFPTAMRNSGETKRGCTAAMFANSQFTAERGIARPFCRIGENETFEKAHLTQNEVRVFF